MHFLNTEPTGFGRLSCNSLAAELPNEISRDQFFAFHAPAGALRPELLTEPMDNAPEKLSTTCGSVSPRPRDVRGPVSRNKDDFIGPRAPRLPLFGGKLHKPAFQDSPRVPYFRRW
jgi:hypothetical protein